MPANLAQGPRTAADARVTAGLSRGPSMRAKLKAAAWSQTWPAPGSTLDLDFANNRGWVRGVGQGGVMDAITFTRASNGNYVGPDGLLSAHANQGALGLNLLTFPQDFDNAAWLKSNATVTANAGVAPDGTATADLVAFSATGSIRQEAAVTTSSASLWVKRAQTGSATAIRLATNNTTAWATGYGVKVTLTDEWQRISATGTLTSGSTTRFSIGTLIDTTGAGDADCVGNVLIWGAQLEVGSSATTYYPTNIGLPRFDWGATASTGAGTIADPRVIPLAANPTSNGILIEEARTNRILWCRDATQTNWTKTNVTAAKDQTGVDGVANAASSLTATSANGTCIQTITLASGSRTGSVYLKRITGTGDVQVTLDGTTYSTVALSSTEWRRIVLSGTVTNPVVGIRIVTNGDAVAMDYAQVEDGAFATSPILTTTATATRSADVATMTGGNFNSWYVQGGGTLYGEWERRNFVGFMTIAALNNGNTQNLMAIRYNSNGFNPFTDFANVTVFNGSITSTTAIARGNGAFKQDYFSGAINNSAPIVDTGGQIPNVTLLSLGSLASSAFLNGTLKRLTYYPTRLPDTALQVLTSAT